MIKIVVPGELPAQNEIIKAAKSSPYAYSRMKKDSTNTITWLSKNKANMDRIWLDITYVCKNRRKDPDNIAAAKKFILDGLVAAGVIPNDGWNEIAGWTEDFKIDKQNPRIEIVIKEVG